MTRDYKPAARPRRAPAQGSGSSLLVGMLIGLLLGLGIAIGVAIYLNSFPGLFSRTPKPPPNSGAQQPTPPAKQAPAATQPDGSTKSSGREEGARFDFYTILPGNTDGPATASRPEPPPPVKGQVKETFLLQVGAFQNEAEAENLKARLAFMGIEAAIQPASVSDKGTVYRVRAGPYTRVEDVNRVRDTLKRNGIDSTLVRAREARP